MAIGMVAGLAIPGTAKENQLMGKARDSVLEKAQPGAQDTMQKAQVIAHGVLGTAKEGAQREGLTG
jgi:hypothetical protein